LKLLAEAVDGVGNGTFGVIGIAQAPIGEQAPLEVAREVLMSPSCHTSFGGHSAVRQGMAARAASDALLARMGPFSNFAGPTVISQMGRDPAFGSSLLLTFATDSMGLVLFLGLATSLSPR
jgi:hypothetical protein